MNTSLFQKSDNHRCITILGMHRSGTSLLTGSLQEAGLELGDVVTEAPHNRKGNRESLLIRTLHEELLSHNHSSWDQPPAKNVKWCLAHQQKRDIIIKHYAKYDCWGFKDPRTLFCLEGWIAGLPSLEAVGIFRHPEEVARSLQERNKIDFFRGLEMWHQYNTRLLVWKKRLDFPLIEFTSSSEDFTQTLAKLCSFLRLSKPLQAQEFKFQDFQLRHQNRTTQELPTKLSKLYEELKLNATSLI
jgi:hypothetical protein